MDDESRKIILARRARFVAAALASVGFVGHACGGKTNDSDQSNTSAGQTSAGTGAGGVAGTPQPCLNFAAGTSNVGGASAGTGTAPSSGASAPTGSGGQATGGTPQPCLSPTLGGTAGAGIPIETAGSAAVPQPCLR